MGEEDEEDYGALIYRESQLRKAEVVAKNTKKRNKDSSADVSQFVLLHHLKSVQKTKPSKKKRKLNVTHQWNEEEEWIYSTICFSSKYLAWGFCNWRALSNNHAAMEGRS